MNHMIVLALETPETSTAALAGTLERLVADQIPEITKHCVIFQEEGHVIMYQDGLGGDRLPRETPPSDDLSVASDLG